MLTNLTLGSAWSTRAMWSIPATCPRITTEERGNSGEMRNRATENILSMLNHTESLRRRHPDGRQEAS